MGSVGSGNVCNQVGNAFGGVVNAESIASLVPEWGNQAEANSDCQQSKCDENLSSVFCRQSQELRKQLPEFAISFTEFLWVAFAVAMTFWPLAARISVTNALAIFRKSVAAGLRRHV